MMDWAALISALSGILSGGGVVALLNWRAEKRKAEAEAKQAEAEATKTSAESKSMLSASEDKFIDQIQEQAQSYMQALKEKDAKIEELYASLRTEQNKTIVCASNLCIHHGCEQRMPGKGLGLNWVNDHKAETDLGGDYDSLDLIYQDWLNKKKGVKDNGNNQ